MQLGRRRRRYVSSPLGLRSDSNRTSALTASGQRIKSKDADSLQRLAQAWQKRAFGYYDMLGEIKYASQFYSRALSQIRLFPAELDADGDWVETEDANAVEALDRIQDPGGGRTALQANYGRLMFLAGEAYLFVSHDDETDVEQWEMLSTDELRVQGTTYLRYAAPSTQGQEFHEISDDDWTPDNTQEGLAYRIWQRHPQYSLLPDSTMQGVLDLCEELVLLTQAVRARARSRLAGAGILFVDDKIAPAPLEPVGDEDPEEDIFMRDLTEAMTSPISNEGSAAAVVPLVVRVGVPEGANLANLVYHLQLVDPIQLYPETGLRYECIKRIAIGLDMPPEVLLGLTDANHWTGWMIDEQTWTHHLKPKADQLVADLTSAYYHPTLKSAGVADWDRFSIQYDASAIINHPDRSKDAKDLYDRRAIGKTALRDAAGFAEDDAPTDDELIEMVAVQTNNADLSSYALRKEGAIPAVALQPMPPVPVPPGRTPAALPPAQAPETPAGVEPGVPATESTQASGNGHSRAERDAQAARILGAADLALLRCREAAGNRIRSYAKRDAEARQLVRGVAAASVAATLGRDVVKQLRCPPELELVSSARPLIVDALLMWGFNDTDLAERVAEMVEQHAARTLYERRPAPLPSSFQNWLTGLTSLVP